MDILMGLFHDESNRKEPIKWIPPLLDEIRHTVSPRIRNAFDHEVYQLSPTRRMTLIQREWVGEFDAREINESHRQNYGVNEIVIYWTCANNVCN